MVLQENSFESDGFVFGAASSEGPSVAQKTAESRQTKPKFCDGKSLTDYK